MDKSRNEICPCMGKGIQSPSLRALIVIVNQAEQKRKEAEAAQSIVEPRPGIEPPGKPEGAFYTPSMNPCG